MLFLLRNWPFWFLMMCKNTNKPANAKYSPDDMNYWIHGNKGDMHEFRALLKNAKNVLIITGAGVSQPSGIPTLQGTGGFWRKQKTEDICKLESFEKDPANFWEYFHYFRELCRDKTPNKAHNAIADFQKRMMKQNRNVTLITINIDGLHQKAESPSVVEFHGNVFETVCMGCGNIELNMDKPIAPVFLGREKYVGRKNTPLPIDANELPKCKFRNCSGLLRPNVVLFGEDIPKEALANATEAVKKCDLCLVIGTSSKVYPTAAYGPKLQAKKIPVAEFNKKESQFTYNFRYFFNGSCEYTVPEALAPFEDNEGLSESSQESLHSD